MKIPEFPDMKHYEPLMVELQLPLIGDMPCKVTVHLMNNETHELRSLTVAGPEPDVAYAHALNMLKAVDLAAGRQGKSRRSSSSGSQEGLDVTLGDDEDLMRDDEIPF